jgi:predicted nucleic acid-binding protein
MIYVDTSVIVALLTREPTTDEIIQWFAATIDSLVSAD